jgi:hypothetical protein
MSRDASTLWSCPDHAERGLFRTKCEENCSEQPVQPCRSPSAHQHLMCCTSTGPRVSKSRIVRTCSLCDPTLHWIWAAFNLGGVRSPLSLFFTLNRGTFITRRDFPPACAASSTCSDQSILVLTGGTLGTNLNWYNVSSFQIEARNLQLESLPFQLQEEVGQSLALLQKSAQEKGLALSCHFGKGVPSAVIGDPMRLRQVILNLVGNALKFTPAGWIRVSVTMAEVIDGGGSDINSSEDTLRGSVGVSGGPSREKGAHVIENEASTGDRKLDRQTVDVRKESADERGAVQQEGVAETSGRGGGGVAAVEGGPVSYLRPDMASRVVQFEVQDTGIGVPDEARDRIFKAFMQGDSSTSRRYGEKGVSPWQMRKRKEAADRPPIILLFWVSTRQRKEVHLVKEVL